MSIVFKGRAMLIFPDNCRISYLGIIKPFLSKISIGFIWASMIVQLWPKWYTNVVPNINHANNSNNFFFITQPPISLLLHNFGFWYIFAGAMQHITILRINDKLVTSANPNPNPILFVII